MKNNIPTKTIGTKDAYIKRALWFESFALKNTESDQLTPTKIALFAIKKKETWSTSTWRQIKASLIYKFEEMKSNESKQAIELLLAESQSGTVKRSKKTSAQRNKNINDQDYDLVIACLINSRSKYAEKLRTWIILGSNFGLRPHEWSHASVCHLSDMDVNGYGNDLQTKPYLRVLNSKNTNARTHGDYRHLCLAEVDKEIVNKCIEFTIFMSSIFAESEYDKFYNGCRKLLLRINNANNLQNKKHIQIYSARHKFASAAKNNFTKAEVAAMMGHANDITADGHYGRKNAKNTGIPLTPINSEVSKIILKNKGIPASVKSNHHSKNELIKKALKMLPK